MLTNEIWAVLSCLCTYETVCCLTCLTFKSTRHFNSCMHLTGILGSITGSYVLGQDIWARVRSIEPQLLDHKEGLWSGFTLGSFSIVLHIPTIGSQPWSWSLMSQWTALPKLKWLTCANRTRVRSLWLRYEFNPKLREWRHDQNRAASSMIISAYKDTCKNTRDGMREQIRHS